MTIALEARALSGAAGGVVRYIQGLLGGLQPLLTEHRLTVLLNHPDALPLVEGFPARVVPPASVLTRLYWNAVLLPAAVRSLKPDVLHLTKPSAPLTRRGLPPTVVTIYDLIPLTHPWAQTAAQRWYWHWELPRAARAATHILTISEASKRAMVERFGVPPERVTVTLPGLEQDFAPQPEAAVARLRARYGLPRHYVLTVGTIEPRKNLDGLLRAFALLTHTFPHQLVIAGRWGWKTAVVRRALRDRRLAGRVRLLGRVPRGDLPSLYAGAAALAFVSLAEGFGFPPLEAMACGTPAVVSNTTSLPEVVGDAGVLVDPADTDAIALALRRVLEDSQLRAGLRDRGLHRARAFTWDRTARDTLAVYRRVLRS